MLVKGKNDSRACSIPKSSGLKKLVKSAGRLNRPAIARQVMKDRRIRCHILNLLEKDIQKEIAQMCSIKSNSLLQHRHIDALNMFSWDVLLSELRSTAPTLLRVLEGCANVKRRVRRYRGHGQRKKRLQTARTSSNSTVVGLCAAVLLRHHNKNMNLVQRIISVILHCGHAAKQVQ